MHSRASVRKADSELHTYKTHSLRIAALTLCTGLVIFIWGCGGGGSTPTQSTSNPTPTPTGGGGTTSPATGATVISVGAGQPVNGVDINVSAPATSPAINAELLGVSAVNTGGSASNSGST